MVNLSLKFNAIIKFNFMFSIFTLLILFFSIMGTNVQAQIIEESPKEFASEILLNKPGIIYDTTLLDEFAEIGAINVIEIEHPSGISINDTTIEISQEIPNNKSSESDNIEDYQWLPGKYYIYRSHYNQSLGIVIHEDSNELSGLSISIVIPTKKNVTKIEFEHAQLFVNTTIQEESSLNKFMEDLGYIEEEQDGTFGNYSYYLFVKGDIRISIESSTTEGALEDSEPFPTAISVEAPKDEYYLSVDNEVKSLLGFLEVDPNLWSNAVRFTFDIFKGGYELTVNINPDDLAWGDAYKTELEWLANMAIIQGLTDEDISQIEMQVGPGFSGLEARIIFADNKWQPYFVWNPNPPYLKTELESSAINIFGKDIPAESPNQKDLRYISNPSKHNKLNYFSIIGAIILFLLISTFSYSRLKRRTILDNLNRKNIFDLIKSSPGIHFKKILRELDFQPGALSYHLNVLEKGEYIKSIQDGNYRRFYLFGSKSDWKIALTSIQLRILSIVDERPGISQVKISERIGKNRMLVNYHIKILTDAGVLSLERSGRETQCYTTDRANNYLPE